LISNRTLSPAWIEVFKILAARARKDGNFADTLAGIFAGLLPARDVLKLIGGTLGQTARTLTSKAANIALGGPREWANLGVGTAQAGFQLARNAAKDPASLAEWLQSAGASTTEFGLQASRSEITSRPRGLFFSAQKLIRSRLRTKRSR
jgi:hypothetical protein